MNELPKPPRQLMKLAGLLKRKKYRRLENLSTAEGVKLIEEALAAEVPLHSAFFTREAASESAALVDRLGKAGAEVFALSPAELERISSLKSPPGSLIIYRTNFAPPEKDSSFILALHQISDPGNLGTIIRSADWFGIRKIMLSPSSAELHNPVVVRGSMGAVFRLPVETDVDLVEAVENLKREGNRVIIAAARGGTPPRRISGKIILILGDEQGRLPAEIEGLADDRITIPRLGEGESLNLAAAGSIMMYELTLMADEK